MPNLELIPFLRITIAFIVGIVMGIWSFLTIPLLILKNVRANWIFVVLICGGGALKMIHGVSSTLPTETRSSEIVVVGDSVSNYHYAKVISHSPHTKILLQNVDNLAIGDTISTYLYFEEIDKYRVDIRSLFHSAKLQDIKYIGYLYNDQLLYTTHSKLRKKKIDHTREYIIDKIERLSLTSNDKAIVRAMIIGDRSSIDDKTNMLYRKAGIAHALAVSGMHVGVIFLILNLLLRFMNIFLALRVAKIAIIIIILTLYAALCGATPSVVRAVVMFSLFQATSFTITSRYHAYNILFFTAFTMIAIDPYIIWDVSFQLSYTAMLGVLYSATKCNQYITLKNRILRWLLSSIVVTIAVTIFILPLSLYYFGEGSVFSPLTNIVVALLLPLIFGSIWLWIAFEPHFIDTTLNFLFSLLNQTIEWVASFDIFYINLVIFNISDLILAYTAIILTVIAIGSKKNSLNSEN